MAAITMTMIEDMIDEAILNAGLAATDLKTYRDVFIGPLKKGLLLGVKEGLWCNEKRIKAKFLTLETLVKPYM